MTSESLQLLLDRLNQNETSSFLMFSKSLSSSVDFAKIWIEKPKVTDNVSSYDGPDYFYLIKNDQNIFVAVVFDMRRDLHWYVHSGYRGKGYLTKAMRATIIPHLFLSRSEQRITIKEDEIGLDNFKASEKVAYSLGFLKKEEGEYLLNANNISEQCILQKDRALSENRINELKKYINFLSRSLWTVQTEIEMSYGETDYSDELKDLVKEIRDHTWKLDDFYWKSKAEEIEN